jgi:hypothetical protein
MELKEMRKLKLSGDLHNKNEIKETDAKLCIQFR